MMSSLTLSIVTPSFNQARYIRQTVRSVLEQRVPVEHIVMDGGSTDGTREILEEYDTQLAYWESRPDKGQTDALNRGMERARGDVVGWINSDDYYLPGAFDAVLRRFACADRPDVVFGGAVTVDEGGRLLRENRHGDFSLERLASIGMDVNQQALFWRRDVNPLCFPLDVSLRFCMDLQLIARLGLAGARVARVPRLLGAFRLHGASKTTNLADVRHREEGIVLGELHQRGYPRRSLTIQRHRLAKRLELCATGEWRYALLGGRFGISNRTLAIVHAAAAWDGPVAPESQNPAALGAHDA